MDKPGLFGINHTNRDYTLKKTWDKNQFNSSFPASLYCYLASKGISANYLSIFEEKFAHKLISVHLSPIQLLSFVKTVLLKSMTCSTSSLCLGYPTTPYIANNLTAFEVFFKESSQLNLQVSL